MCQLPSQLTYQGPKANSKVLAPELRAKALQLWVLATYIQSGLTKAEDLQYTLISGDPEDLAKVHLQKKRKKNHNNVNIHLEDFKVITIFL